ncbi:MAG: hypothetical protein WA064_04980 [Candidatus Moraniibacteriota bacterium]
MFGLKNNADTNLKTNPSSANLNQKDSFNIEDFPVHTMADDMAQIKNPTNAKNVPSVQNKNTTTEENLSEKQKTSPFLSPENSWNERSILSEAPGATTPQTKITTPKSAPIETPKITSPTKTEPINWKVVTLFLISLVLVFALAFAGYSFWQKKATQTNEQPPLINPESENSEETPTEEVAPTIPEQPTMPSLSFSESSPNYLPLGENSGDTQKTKDLLAQYIQKVTTEGYTKPIEFIPTDEKNAPLTFNDFSVRFGLSLSPTLTSSLGNTFSLFIYNDTVVSRVGLVIDAKDETVLSKALIQEEKNLADEISSLFFVANYSKDEPFYDNEYKNVNIRYQNIISPENLSVDYAVTKNKLLIGTTKMTMYALIDHLGQVSSQAAPSVILDEEESVDNSMGQ